MTDNFDSNIAQRKPSTKNKRPIHPWDILPKSDVSTDIPEDSVPVNNPVKNIDDSAINNISGEISSYVKDIPEKPVIVPEQKVSGTNKDIPVSHKNETVVYTFNDLSDSINIHSNYHKMQNDVSDHLFRTLSPSAQSIYFRLYRLAYGWNRNWASESLPKLSEACNMSLQTVRKAIKELEDNGCIRKNSSDYHKATVYRIFLPSENDNIKFKQSINSMSINMGLIIDSLNDSGENAEFPNSKALSSATLNSDSDMNDTAAVKNYTGDDANSGGAKSYIQSIYFRGTSVYTILESGGSLPKNIFIYMNNTHISEAVQIIDEFYDSIGFSIVARAEYRKALLVYFELIKSGFSPDDIRYAVRWIFKNSKSRPESFSLVNHVIHLAMDDMIKNLKNISGEKDVFIKKIEAIKKKKEFEDNNTEIRYSEDDFAEWLSVVEDLRENLNEHSFNAFILPLKLISAEGETVILISPPESLSWVDDHFKDKIEESYFSRTGKKIMVSVK